jgi:hypothetical protein
MEGRRIKLSPKKSTISKFPPKSSIHYSTYLVLKGFNSIRIMNITYDRDLLAEYQVLVIFPHHTHVVK